MLNYFLELSNTSRKCFMVKNGKYTLNFVIQYLKCGKKSFNPQSNFFLSLPHASVFSRSIHNSRNSHQPDLKFEKVYFRFISSNFFKQISLKCLWKRSKNLFTFLALFQVEGEKSFDFYGFLFTNFLFHARILICCIFL